MAGRKLPDGVHIYINGQPIEFDECRCGHGWCEQHGTYDLPKDFDVSYTPLNLQKGTRGGRRVQHKKLTDRNY